MRAAALPGRLDAALRATRPSHARPSRYAVVDALSTLGDGAALDRAALAARVDETAPVRRRVAPRTARERALCQLWQAVLDAPAVGVDDDFLDLGGHSLKAVQMLARAEAELGLRFALDDLFTHPTIAQLVQLAETRGDADRAARAPIPALPPQPAYPASRNQMRLWTLDQLEDDLIAYNIAFAISMPTPVDADALAAAMAILTERHASLRARFAADDDGRPQVRMDDVPAATPEIVALEDADAAAVRAHAEQIAARPFDLARGPLWRVALLTRASSAWIVCCLHHIISDVWSLGVFTRELLAAYRDAAADRPIALPPAPRVQPQDVVAWRQSPAQQERIARDVAYWRDALADLDPPVTYPEDRPRPARQTHRGASTGFVLDAAEAETVRALGRAHGATLFMTVVALVQSQLQRRSAAAGTAACREVVVGSVIAGREHPDTRDPIGFFVENLALRARFDDPDLTVAQHLRATRAATLDAFAHASAPWDRVVEVLDRPRDPRRNAIFDVMIVMDDRDDVRALSAEHGVAVLELETPTSQFDVTFYVTDAPDAIRVHVVYNTDLYDRATIDDVLAELRVMLLDAARDADRRLVDLGRGNTLSTASDASDAVSIAPSHHQARLWFVDRFEAGTLYPAGP
ncbi:MAG: condensation domain-containing protein, partial [Acidobacteriota bacterium]